MSDLGKSDAGIDTAWASLEKYTLPRQHMMVSLFLESQVMLIQKIINYAHVLSAIELSSISWEAFPFLK